YARAGECLAKALSIGTDNYAVRRGFVDSLRAMKLTEYSEHFEKAIMICLNDPHISKQYLSSSWLVTLQKKPELAEVSALLRNQGGYDRVVKMLKMVRSQPTFADPFFLTGLANIVVGSMYFENMVVYLRRYALMHRKEVESWGWLPLLAALAHQCFMVEYIGEETAEETKHIEVLLQELDAKDSPVADLLLAAAYRPLLGMKDPKAISARLHGEADAEIRRIAREQLDEPLEEQSIVSDIETLGEVSDEISQAVQNQYEENPYPRWTLVTQSARLPFAKVIKALFPFLEEDALPKAEKPRILIPGCGTGKQVISSINRLDSCDVLAVDLSKASLSYAIRKTRELGYDNITFKQADILKLPEVV
ncbi:MAG: methyltransferase domain-containing protein, partial [Rickettsiales bacterium]